MTITTRQTTLFLAASVAVVIGSYGSLYLLIINL
jgi:hypothetical protein